MSDVWASPQKFALFPRSPLHVPRSSDPRPRRACHKVARTRRLRAQACACGSTSELIHSFHTDVGSEFWTERLSRELPGEFVSDDLRADCDRFLEELRARVAFRRELAPEGGAGRHGASGIRQVWI